MLYVYAIRLCLLLGIFISGQNTFNNDFIFVDSQDEIDYYFTKHDTKTDKREVNISLPGQIDDEDILFIDSQDVLDYFKHDDVKINKTEDNISISNERKDVDFEGSGSEYEFELAKSTTKFKEEYRTENEINSSTYGLTQEDDTTETEINSSTFGLTEDDDATESEVPTLVIQLSEQTATTLVSETTKPAQSSSITEATIKNHVKDAMYNLSCTEPGMQKVCSGNGLCNKGTCHCYADEEDEFYRYSGKYCEECPYCKGQRCKKFLPCIKCKAIYKNENCSSECFFEPLLTEVIERNIKTDDKMCDMEYDIGCYTKYKYHYDKNGILFVQTSKYFTCYNGTAYVYCTLIGMMIFFICIIMFTPKACSINLLDEDKTDINLQQSVRSHLNRMSRIRRNTPSSDL